MNRIVLPLLIACSSASAADLTHQGRLLDALGAPVDGTHAVTIALHSHETNDAPISTHVFSTLSLSNGYYSVVLSDVPDEMLAGPVWVGVNVGGGELLPRSPIGTTPRAVIATSSSAREGAGTDEAHAATSCKSLHTTYPDLPSASYWIDIDGASSAFAPMQSYCDMAARGGGWTLCYEADVAWGPVVITGWHNRLNTTPRGAGEDSRGCRDMTGQYSSPEAKVVYIDGSYMEARHTAAPTLNNGGYWEFNSYIGPYNIGIEIENSGNPGRGHCFDQAGEDNSWGRAGVSQSCFLDTSPSAFYNGLIHVEYWLR
jgi:hypothetical protein